MSSCDVFISYKRGDGKIVEPVVQKFKQLGLSVWLDTRLEAGPSFDEQIAGKLRAAQAVLVCWTPDAIASQWVRGEAALAHESGKLVACFLKPTKLLPPFNLIQTENLADWDGEDDHAGWSKTLTRIASLSDQDRFIKWAQLMSTGDPAALREWATKQPPGPLRSTSRFWMSELDGATVAIPDVALTSRKQRTVTARWRRLKWWQKLATAFAAAGLFGGVYVAWATLTRDRNLAIYDIVFDGPIQVYEGADVRFNGITVGTIGNVKLDREDPNRVIARINVDAQTPVRQDSVATQSLDRATGGFFVQLHAGDPNQPLLVSGALGDTPVIPSGRTAQDEMEIGQQDLLSIQGQLYVKQLEYYELMLERMKQEKTEGEATVAGEVKDPQVVKNPP